MPSAPQLARGPFGRGCFGEARADRFPDPEVGLVLGEIRKGPAVSVPPQHVGSPLQKEVHHGSVSSCRRFLQGAGTLVSGKLDGRFPIQHQGSYLGQVSASGSQDK